MKAFVRLSGPPAVEETAEFEFRTFTRCEWELPDPSSKSIARIREELAAFAEAHSADPLHTGRELVESDDGDEEEALLIRLVMKKPVKETTARWVNTIVENALQGKSASSR